MVTAGVVIASSTLLLSAYSQLPSSSISLTNAGLDGESNTELRQNITNVGIEQTLQTAATLPTQPNLTASTPGSMRVSNATYHPVRIALLPQVQPTDNGSLPQRLTTAQSVEVERNEVSMNVATNAVISNETSESPQYGEPIHWDFVPREGHESGLVLAIAEGYIKVQTGDILTAFAQDGSRRYWGPYVVGITESPVWNSETQEWSLVLESPFPF
ncbi:MAG: hypothetical protein AAGD25_36170 [Cyanobacteria bacterium P01_F01_bin.150]